MINFNFFTQIKVAIERSEEKGPNSGAACFAKKRNLFGGSQFLPKQEIYFGVIL